MFKLLARLLQRPAKRKAWHGSYLINDFLKEQN